MTFYKGLTQAKLVSWQALPPRGSRTPKASGQSSPTDAVKWEHYVHPNEYSDTRRIELHWSHLHRSNLVPEREDINHIRRFWNSPEGFQKAALSELDSFDRFIADWKDRGFRVSLSKPPFVGGKGNPPDKTTAPNDFVAKVFAGAKQHMQTRREILFAHTDELHQAMQESFPAMLQLLDELQKPAHLP